MNARLIELLEDQIKYLEGRSLEAQRKGKWVEAAEAEKLIGRISYQLSDFAQGVEEVMEEL